MPGTTVRSRYDGASNPLDDDVTVPHWRYNRVAQHRGTDYRYDIYGRTTEKRKTGERWLYRYDSEHRLIQVLHQPVSHTRPECVVDFCYDVLGRRVSKRVHYRRMEGTGGGPQYRARETRFLWEGPRLLAEYTTDSSGDNVQVYTYSGQHSFAPLARIDGAGEVYYFHCQVNGQPEAMTDSAGETVWSGEPDIRGKITSENSSLVLTGRGEQNLMMQGQYLDRETGLHYNLHRYYDPDSGRFTQHDPIGLAGGINLYQYAPNPLKYIDPLGLCKKTIDTPYGPAHQSNSMEALAARAKIEDGATLYRMGTTGRSETTGAQFWALEHPSTPGYAGKYGIPQENIDNSNFIMTAKLKPVGEFVTRQAPGIGDNPGGGIEVVVPSDGVDIITFSKY